MKTRALLAIVIFVVIAASAALPMAAPARAFAAAPTPWIGFYVPGAPMDVSSLATLESRVGGSAKVSNYFQNTTEGFLSAAAGNAVTRGTIPMATLEFWNGANGVNQPSFSLKSISGGAFDAYLHSYARSAKAFGSEVWLRPLHEMNGNWYPWCGTVNGNTPADFVPAWRHIRDIFTAEGATNVKFVWAPNADSVPGTAANAIAAYWPGDAYVDYVAMDGYNFGGTTAGSWRSFDSVFASAYAKVTALSAKPLIIAETACSPIGGDKAAWIANMFASLPASYPRIVGVVWFNTNKEADWRVESSSASLAAFVSGMASLVPEPPASPTAMPVYRFYNTRTSTHFYTANPAERNQVLATLAATYRYEGVAYTINTLNTANDASLFRFYNVSTGTHFYTANVAERDSVIARMGNTYHYEGVAYHVSASSSGTTPVFRFYNTSTGTHFYTANPAERDSVIANLSATYNFEGPVFFVAN